MKGRRPELLILVLLLCGISLHALITSRRSREDRYRDAWALRAELERDPRSVAVAMRQRGRSWRLDAECLSGPGLSRYCFMADGEDPVTGSLNVEQKRELQTWINWLPPHHSSNQEATTYWVDGPEGLFQYCTDNATNVDSVPGFAVALHALPSILPGRLAIARGFVPDRPVPGLPTFEFAAGKAGLPPVRFTTRTGVNPSDLSIHGVHLGDDPRKVHGSGQRGVLAFATEHDGVVFLEGESLECNGQQFRIRDGHKIAARLGEPEEWESLSLASLNDGHGDASRFSLGRYPEPGTRGYWISL